MDVYSRISLACDAGAHGVDDAEDAGTFRLCQFYCSQRVGSLAALAYCYDDIGGVDDRVAVTELTGVINLHRYLAVLLNELLSYEPSMPARSAGNDDEALGRHQAVLVVLDR